MTAHDTSTEAVTSLLEGVTPGPWHVSDECNVSCDGYSVVHGSVMVFDDLESLANARFIAAARELVPAISAERDRLAAQVVQLQRDLDAAKVRAERAVKVKPLEWVSDTYTSTDDDGGRMEGIPRKLFAWRAEHYLIIQQVGPYGLFILRGSTTVPTAWHSLNSAKAAAQADYEARILSAPEKPHD